jgi:hypothetical protein
MKRSLHSCRLFLNVIAFHNKANLPLIYWRDGGIIRNGENGRIVALLRDVDFLKEQTELFPINGLYYFLITAFIG